MTHAQQGDWLDKAILQAAPDWSPRTDFRAWRETHAEALESLGHSAAYESHRPAVPPTRRHFLPTSLTKLAVAAGILVIVGAIIYRLNPSLDPASAAFAQVCHSVSESSTIRFDVTCRAPNGQGYTGRVYEKAGCLVRTEIETGDAAPWNTILRDRQTDRTLFLDTQAKRAWHPGPRLRVEDRTTNIYEFFSNFLHASGYSVKELGESTIDQRSLIGFHLTKMDVSFSHEQCAIWADPETMRPVRIDVIARMPDGGTMELTITNMVFNEPLDDSLFDFQPQGYQIDPPMPEQASEESSAQ